MTSLAFARKTRNAVAAASDGLPTLQEWLDRVEAIGHPLLTATVEGIWCGRSGRACLPVTGTNANLVVGWHNGKVEFSYLS